MPIPIPKGQHISIQKRLLSPDSCMSSMQVMVDYYNIGYIISGDRYVITPVETYSYHKGDVALAPPLFFHRTFSDSNEPYETILIKFTPDFVKPFIDIIGENEFKNFYNSKTFHFTKNTQQKVLNIFEDMLNEYQKKTCYKELILQGMLFRLFTTIIEEHLPVSNNIKKESTPLTKQIIEILYYLESHYQENPTLSQIAKMVNISEGHLSRLFHSQLGIPYSKYLNNLKIEHVKLFLLKTDKSITDIALSTGYCNSEYLSANFKKNTGMTPKDFRIQGKNGHIKL